MKKFITAKEAAALLKDGQTVCCGGFGSSACPDELYQAVADRYSAEGHPVALKLVGGICPGDFKTDVGLNRLKAPGLIGSVYAGHFFNPHEIGKMIGENKITAYAVPLGVVLHVLRAIAGKKPAVLTPIGLGTFADPRIEGCKANQLTMETGEDIVELLRFGGKDYLAYKTFPVDVALIRGTYADEDGNISVEQEGVGDYALEMAEAVHACGGKVIVQVRDIVSRGSLHPRRVRIHKTLVDYVVKNTDPMLHMQSYADMFRPEVSGDFRIPTGSLAPMELSPRKVIARRAAMELNPDCLINLGIGIPSGIGSVANEEGFGDRITTSLESGPQGGVAVEGLGFGGAVNAECIYDCCDMFDMYDGGVLDRTFLGFAQVDEKGNVNASKFSNRCTGPGGFVNISQNTPTVVFVGTLTAGGLREEIGDGKLRVLKEGVERKFIKSVEQITFSGDYSKSIGQRVMYITERAVFELRPEGLALTEIAPGIDLQKDVLDQMEFAPIISEDLKEMDSRIFKEETMGISLKE